MPLVSVLLPVYNAERYLGPAIESILTQTFTDFELLITDDGSSDRSLEILQSYAAQDTRIRLLSRENKGLIYTLNEMLEQANGEFLARMDADDIATPDRLALQVQFLRQHPEVVCVGGAFDLIDPQGRTVQWIPMPEHNDEIQQMLLIGRTIINHPCALMRRSALQQIGGYDPDMKTVEDLDMLLRLGEIGQLANLPDVVLKYRFHPNSVSAQNILFQSQMAERACQKAWTRRGISGYYDSPQPWYRPLPEPDSQQQFWHHYGWWAFCNGFRLTAAECGLKAIAAKPTTLKSWKLLACALIKPIPKPVSNLQTVLQPEKSV
ncbi:glycosyltransferase [Leptolyngbya sp. NK1-12]|uniref:Glycosyltransferase n=1 Tax=Leptolyngbya sp. NK1-12 TaxID=2547451 RepID=A0AA96WGS2_9CYAN|nr:glycosyltransferase [Leptolyngbya sp. NK1-12]